VPNPHSQKFSIAPSRYLEHLGRGVGVLSEVQTKVCRKDIHDRAYISISVTSGIGAVLCRVPGAGVFRGSGVRLCRMLDMTCREYLFHALG
jgi:hypothetical protein